MKWIVSMVLMTFQILNAQGEKYFISSYDLLDVDNGYRIIDTPENGYIIGGDALDYDSNMWNFQILHLNNWGEVQSICGHYNGAYHTAFRDIVKINNGYFIGGFVTDEIANGIRSPYFAVLDYNCDFMDYGIRGDTSYNGNIFACTSSNDGGYLLGGKPCSIHLRPLLNGTLPNKIRQSLQPSMGQRLLRFAVQLS